MDYLLICKKRLFNDKTIDYLTMSKKVKDNEIVDKITMPKACSECTVKLKWYWCGKHYDSIQCWITLQKKQLEKKCRLI